MDSDDKQIDLVCLGEPMVELNQQQDKIFVQGYGGDTSNCAISAARQGARVGYITNVGDDQFGRSLMALWETEGIDTSQVSLNPTAPTGIYFVTHDESGHHYTYYRKHSAAAMMLPSELTKKYIANARILHVSAISQAISDSASETVMEAIQIANENNTMVAYDTNLRLNLWNQDRAREVIHKAMSHCQIALPSYDDATILTQLNDPQSIVDFYLALGCKTVVLKLGAKGAIVATNDRQKTLPAKNIKSIDTNAAGDTFAGALLAELVKGTDVFSAAEYANTAAAISTQFNGAVDSIPDRSQVLQRIDQSCW